MAEIYNLYRLCCVLLWSRTGRFNYKVRHNHVYIWYQKVPQIYILNMNCFNTVGTNKLLAMRIAMRRTNYINHHCKLLTQTGISLGWTGLWHEVTFTSFQRDGYILQVACSIAPGVNGQVRLGGSVRNYFSVRTILNSTGCCKLPR